MNRELRKIIKENNKYVDMLEHNPQEAKQNCKEYFEDVKSLLAFINSEIDRYYELLKLWCIASSDAWDIDTNNIFLRFKRFVLMQYTNHFISKYSKILSILGILKSNLEIVSTRLNQFSQLLTHD